MNGLFMGTFDPIKNAVRYEFISITPQPTTQKETTMKETIPHLALRRQWLDEIEKDPKCVWRWRDKGLSDWIQLAPGAEPAWSAKREYSPQPKTKTYYMVMAKHSGVGQVPFGLVFEKTEEISGHLKRFHLDQVGDVVPREVEQ